MRRAREVVPFERGVALFDHELPRAWDLNVVWVTPGDGLDAEQVAGDADRLQGTAGLAHRRLIVPGGAGRRLSGGLAALGWRARERLVMPWTRRAPVGGHAVVELSPDRLEPFWVDGIRRAPWADDATVRQLVAAQHLRRRAAEVRYFAVLVAGAIASTCELFLHGEAAQVESVITEERYGGRGYASAVIARAGEEARAAGCDPVFLLAEADDGPTILYERLGFDTAGSVWEFTRYPARDEMPWARDRDRR